MSKDFFDRSKIGGNQKYDEYIILNNRFSVKVSPVWQDHSHYRFDESDESGNKHEIVVSIEHNIEVPTLKQYAELNIMALAKVIPGYQELKRGQFLLDSGVPAFDLVYKWIPLNDVKYYQRVVYIRINKTGYVLSARFTKKTWKIRGGEVDKMLKSFCVPNVGFQVPSTC